ncbi:MAG: cytochrome c family protein [Hyphomicrobiaceae bacterium]|nr:cytochrome c family protein [Hyphomicrobiaceae bacterium]
MMDSFELSKIAGGVISALLLIFAPKTAIDIMYGGHGGGAHHAVVGYELPKPKAEAAVAAAAEPAEAAFDPSKVVSLVASASADEGKDVFKKCASCHTVDQGGSNKAGPNLWGIVGRPVAAVGGFAYSEALKGKGGEWTVEHLAGFIHGPKAYIPGNKMGFAGVKADAELASLIAYLNTLK